MLHILGLSTVVEHPIWSLYPEHNIALRPLFHQLVKPLSSGRPQLIYVLWSRDGSLDNRPGVLYTPNHFVAVKEEDPFLEDHDIPWELLDEKGNFFEGQKQPPTQDDSQPTTDGKTDNQPVTDGKTDNQSATYGKAENKPATYGKVDNQPAVDKDADKVLASQEGNESVTFIPPMSMSHMLSESREILHGSDVKMGNVCKQNEQVCDPDLSTDDEKPLAHFLDCPVESTVNNMQDDFNTEDEQPLCLLASTPKTNTIMKDSNSAAANESTTPTIPRANKKGRKHPKKGKPSKKPKLDASMIASDIYPSDNDQDDFSDISDIEVDTLSASSSESSDEGKDGDNATCGR